MEPTVQYQTRYKIQKTSRHWSKDSDQIGGYKLFAQLQIYMNIAASLLFRLKISALISVPKTIAPLLGFDFIPGPTRSHFF